MKKSQETKKLLSIGGQAVLEGVMMRAPKGISLAVRRPDGSIMTQYDPYTPPSEKNKFYGLPIVRGVVNFVDMMKVGMKTMTIAAGVLGMDEEPSKFEKWMAKKLGKTVDQIVIGFAIVLAVVLSAGLFIALPSFIGSLVAKGQSDFLLNLVEGVSRLAIFIAYIAAVSAMRDIKRVFMYHGAEHKVIATYEAGEELTVENARTKTKLHPRCGTNYMFLVMMVAIVFFSLLNVGSDIVLRIVTRLVCLPLVAGLAYEVLKAAANSNGFIARAVRWPGLQIQRMTTAEPDDSMLEVAIVAFNIAKDPQEYYAEKAKAEAAAASKESEADSMESDAGSISGIPIEQMQEA